MTTTWTNNELDIHAPGGRLAARVEPTTDDDDGADKILADRIVQLLNNSEHPNVAHLEFSTATDTVRGMLAGEFAHELAERIKVILEKCVGLPTEVLASMPVTFNEALRQVAHMSNSVNAMANAAQDDQEWARLRKSLIAAQQQAAQHIH